MNDSTLDKSSFSATVNAVKHSPFRVVRVYLPNPNICPVQCYTLPSGERCKHGVRHFDTSKNFEKQVRSWYSRTQKHVRREIGEICTCKHENSLDDFEASAETLQRKAETVIQPPLINRRKRKRGTPTKIKIEDISDESITDTEEELEEAVGKIKLTTSSIIAEDDYGN